MESFFVTVIGYLRFKRYDEYVDQINFKLPFQNILVHIESAIAKTKNEPYIKENLTPTV